jgi:DtxR family Mn-dependent transcriptional regulator
VRAHRLWERYLADDAGVPMERLHQAAEKAEHGLTPGRLDELEAHLGHPQTDPHGDPIPARDGSMSSLDAVSLNEWPSDELARIVHIEDEPAVIFRQILAANLRPGVTVRILEDTLNQLVIRADGREHSLPHAVAANIQVAAEQRPTDRLEGARRLSALREGQSARVVEIDGACRGFSRRRLMDLGLTPDTRVEVALENTFGDPRAFRIRGTTIALRSEQADHVWVRPVESEDQEAA